MCISDADDFMPVFWVWITAGKTVGLEAIIFSLNLSFNPKKKENKWSSPNLSHYSIKRRNICYSVMNSEIICSLNILRLCRNIFRLIYCFNIHFIRISLYIVLVEIN